MLWLVFPGMSEIQKERLTERESWWVVSPEDERSFSLGVLQRWSRVLPQLCCSCLNSIQDLKRKTQPRWLLTQQALAMVNNSSSPAHIVMLFTSRTNKLLLCVCVCVSAVKWKVNLSIVEPWIRFVNQSLVQFYLRRKWVEDKLWLQLLHSESTSVMNNMAFKLIVVVWETRTHTGSEC